MAKVKDVYPDVARISLNTEWIKSVTLADIWANYDEETDSMIIYVTGKPVAGVNVYLQDDVYAIVDTRDDKKDGNKVVGFYFESWENYVPKFALVHRSWSEIRGAALRGNDTTLALRVLALELVMSVGMTNSTALHFA